MSTMPEERAEGGAGLWERLWRKFGDVARAMGLVEGEDVEGALEAQKELRSSQTTHKKVGHILVEQGKMEPAHVNEVLSEQRKDAEAIEAKAKEAKRAAAPIAFPEEVSAPKPDLRAKKKAKAKAGKAATGVRKKSGAEKRRAKKKTKKTKKKTKKANKKTKAKKKVKKKR